MSVLASNAQAEREVALVELTQQALQEFGLTGGEVISLDIASFADGTISFSAPLDEVVQTIEVSTYSTRSPNYQLFVDRDGVLEEVEPGPVQTLRGHVIGWDDAIVTGGHWEGGLALAIRVDGGAYYVEPIIDRVEGALPGDHVVYHTNDIIPPDASCGVTGEAMNFAGDVGAALGDGGCPELGPCNGDACVAELAADADFEYFVRYGQNVTSVENRINLVINTMNPQYENEVGITHMITAIIVRTTVNDPYNETSSCGTALNEFQAQWNGNHGDIERDVAELFSNRTSLLGSCAGIASLATVCNTATAYNLVISDCCGGLGCAAQLSAHELGHNWSADHCDPGNPSCNPNPNCSCGFNTMRCSVNCSTSFHETCTRPEIIAFRDVIDCLDGLNAPPENNCCEDRELILNGTFALDTINATQEGAPDLPAECNEGGGTELDNDAWWCWISLCDGTATLDLCNENTDFDTRIAVYGDGCTDCNVTNDRLVACNDNGCDDPALTSFVTWPVAFGDAFLVRIGGPEEGVGEFTIECEDDAGGTDADITGASSLLTHGAGPGTELAIDLVDSNGIEPRQDGATKLTFVMSEDMDGGTVDAGNVQLDCASGNPPAVASATLEGGNTVVVELAAGMANLDCCSVSFDGMQTDSGGVVIGDFDVKSIKGDMDASGAVTGGDASLIKTHFGEIVGVDLTHPKWDYDQSGGVTGGDFSLIKPQFGNIGQACP